MLILGPAGAGKSLLARTFIAAAVKRGERTAMFVFDEELRLLFDRTKGLGIDLAPMVDAGLAEMIAALQGVRYPAIRRRPGAAGALHGRAVPLRRSFPCRRCVPVAVDPVSRLILFNKPYGVLTQFTDGTPRGEGSDSGGSGGGGRPTLSGFIAVPGVYPAGRLDLDSEGLLLLTDDGRLQARIADPRFKLPKTYLVQVEGEPDEAALAALRRGVQLKDGPTRPAEVTAIAPPALWPRDPPVRFRKSVPDSWLRLTIREGRNRQVRRMTAAVGHPTLRLVRWSIGDWTIDGMAPGEWREVAAR